MTTIETYARQLFSQKQEHKARFFPPERTYEAIEICSYATGCTPDPLKTFLQADDIAGYMTHKRPVRDGIAASASLRLVKILRESDGSLRMPCETFLQVFDACKLQSYLLYFLKHSSYIFHRFKPQSPSSPSDPDYAMSFYLNTAFFVLLWSFDAETSSTRAMLLQRRRELETFGELEKLIKIHKSMLADPLMLALVSVNAISEWVDKEIQRGFERVRAFESITGYGTWNRVDISVNIDLAKLDTGMLSKEVGVSLMSFGHMKARMRIAIEVLRCILSGDSGSMSREAIDFADNDRCLAERAKLLLHKTEDAYFVTEYLQERAKNQQDVVSRLRFQHQEIL
jgi:hypothetical protein